MPYAAPKSTSGRTRAERLEARVTPEQKSLIERAAALQGRTVTDFVLTSEQDAAQRAIEEHHQISLSGRASEAFVDALLNPKPVSDRLRATVRRIEREPAFEACQRSWRSPGRGAWLEPRLFRV
jgi:uncharacterized protein (DUF1778 family)